VQIDGANQLQDTIQHVAINDKNKVLPVLFYFKTTFAVIIII
jgi:hypothetical protein